jgi:hypothetical protein
VRKCRGRAFLAKTGEQREPVAIPTELAIVLSTLQALELSLPF